MRRKSLLLIPAAVLLAGGLSVGFVHANTHSNRAVHASTAPHVAAPEADKAQVGDQTTPDSADTKDTGTADVQSGDQNGPDTGTTDKVDTADTTKEAATPHNDTVQSGDQTGPDTGTPDKSNSGK